MRSSSSGSVRFIASHWRPHARSVPVLLSLTIANAFLVMVGPLLLKRIVDGLVRASTRGEIAWGVLLLVAAGTAQVATYIALIRTRVRMNLSFDLGVRQRAFEHLLDLGPAFRRAFRTGDLVTRLTDDVTDKLAWFMCSGVFRLVEAGSLVAVGAVMMARLDPTLALYAAAPLPVLAILFALVFGDLDRRYREVQAAISAEGAAIEGALTGIRVVKAFGAEPSQRAAVGATVERQQHAEVRAVAIQSLVDSLYGHVWQLGIAGVLYFGGLGVLSGRVSLGDIVAFDAYVLALVPPVFDLAQFVVRGRASGVSIARIHEIESARLEIEDRVGEPPRARRPGQAAAPLPEPAAPTAPLEVRFAEVAYTFPDADQKAIAGVAFTAPAGRITALSGPVGSGKSTLLAMVPRLLEPSGGQVTIGGRDVRAWDPAALRRAVAFVPQEPFLFSTTIAENVHLGRSWVTPADVRRAVEAAGLVRDLGDLPHGLETRVGTRGVRLSGGQKQRVALARALAGRPAVLVLDDVTASLDAATESAVWQSLLARGADAPTVIVATHRIATLARADGVIRLGT